MYQIVSIYTSYSWTQVWTQIKANQLRREINFHFNISSNSRLKHIVLVPRAQSTPRPHKDNSKYVRQWILSSNTWPKYQRMQPIQCRHSIMFSVVPDSFIAQHSIMENHMQLRQDQDPFQKRVTVLRPCLAQPTLALHSLMPILWLACSLCRRVFIYLSQSNRYRLKYEKNISMRLEPSPSIRWIQPNIADDHGGS